MYTSSCQPFGNESKGDKASLTTPLFEIKSSISKTASFFYYMNGLNTGSFRVYVNTHLDPVVSTEVSKLEKLCIFFIWCFYHFAFPTFYRVLSKIRMFYDILFKRYVITVG